MAVCEVSSLSSALVNSVSDRARHEALQGLSYLTQSHHIEQVSNENQISRHFLKNRSFSAILKIPSFL